ncbi:MAG: hypothetical protein ACT4PU_08055 [Planctomycetota bacterium]
MPLPIDPLRKPGEMDEAMWAATRRLAALPCNQDGADKTHVLEAIRMMQRFLRIEPQWLGPPDDVT